MSPAGPAVGELASGEAADPDDQQEVPLGPSHWEDFDELTAETLFDLAATIRTSLSRSSRRCCLSTGRTFSSFSRCTHKRFTDRFKNTAMRRRRALQLLGSAALSAAGCVTTDEPQTGTTQTEHKTPAADTDHALGEEVLVDGIGTVTVTSATVQRSVIHYHLYREVYEPVDAQMLVLAGQIPDDADPEFDIQFQARIDGTVIGAAARTWLTSGNRIYALSIPVDTVTEATLVLQTGERPAWTLPETVVDRLAVAPAFHLHDAIVLEADGETALELTVENRGDRDGVFRAVAKHDSAADADAAIRFPVPADDNVSKTIHSSMVRSWPSDADFAREIAADTRVFAVA